MNEFERDLAENMNTIAAARAALLERVRSLTDADLGVTRRGGWSIREVLGHVIEAEASYAKVIAHLRSVSVPVPDVTAEDTASIASAASALERYRDALTSAVAGVDESTFYEMRALGKDQYSVMSVLENVADHDHEHLGQIAKTIGASPAVS